jgi:hypothetical protein
MSTPTDIERRAKQVTRRQERETKRKYEQLAGLVRSQLRKQLDEILKTNTKAFVFLLLEGGALKVNVEVVEKPPEPVIDEPVIPDEDRTPPSSENPSFPPPVAYIPGEDRFEDEPAAEPPPLLVPA